MLFLPFSSESLIVYTVLVMRVIYSPQQASIHSHTIYQSFIYLLIHYDKTHLQKQKLPSDQVYDSILHLSLLELSIEPTQHPTIKKYSNESNERIYINYVFSLSNKLSLHQYILHPYHSIPLIFYSNSIQIDYEYSLLILHEKAKYFLSIHSQSSHIHYRFLLINTLINNHILFLTILLQNLI